jgi:hypothetical protein
VTSDSRAPRPAGHPTGRLYVGTDAEKTVVSPYPLKMRAGRASRRRYGLIVEVTPAVPSGRSRDERTRFVSQLALVAVMVSAVLTGAGVAWWQSAAGAVVLLGWVALVQARAAATGVLALPGGSADDGCHVLYAAPERAAFARAFAVAGRVRRTWPALHHMIDQADAERMLARALTGLAAVLGRRQQLRRLRAELAAVDHRDLPSDSPAVAALLAQRERVEALWRELGEQANRHLAALDAAATAGERLIREQRVGRTARDAEHVIARLSAPAGAGPVLEPDAGRELADRTAAVIDAYRDLAARYSTGV